MNNELNPIVINNFPPKEQDFILYQLQCIINNNEDIKIKNLFPYAIYRYIDINICRIFIFNSDGSLFKHGFVKERHLDGKLFHEILSIKLYKNIKHATNGF